MAWPPTLADLKDDLGVPADDSRDDTRLQRVLDAAVATVQALRPRFAYPALPDVGDVIELSITAVDAGGDPANCDTVTLSVETPDGESEDLSVDNPPATTGRYTASYTTSQEGVHVARWTTTGPASTTAQRFVVRELGVLPDPPCNFELGAIRLAGRWHARRRSVDGLIQMAEMGAARIPTIDADIERLLGIGRYRRSVIA